MLVFAGLTKLIIYLAQNFCMSSCYFCDVQKTLDKGKIFENKLFFSRLSNYPVSKGHCEVIVKEHIPSFFDLSSKQAQSLFEAVNETCKIIKEKFSPDGFNLGINEGVAAGRSIEHFHFHVIPRYVGDVSDPTGGIRNVLQGKGEYLSQAQKDPRFKKYYE